ncbi:hypothetical protein CHS0354_031665 [Potamilus streckersoni]|uniref:F-BAR domain-containing protein n=1 Tax=Potamilus streckersoni TaxID=2493646 RepID=A0AAE0TFQ4_9BIVA|nr:hypothetical protein CHS0354_031665 [Potamilus streckersoni]
MTRPQNGFRDSFWDPEFTGTRGWEAIIKRMRDGKKVCDDVVKFVKERAKAETEYTKLLTNLVKKADGKEETGILGNGWRELKSQTESIAQLHFDASKQFEQLADELAAFNLTQKETKKKVEQTMKNLIQSRNQQYQRTEQARNTYMAKCKEKDLSEEQYSAKRQGIQTTTKELQKFESKVSKCKVDADLADSNYKTNIDHLEKIREVWESEMEKHCMICQELEVQRISYMRDLLWRATNIESDTCVKQDECVERVRLQLEPCDVTGDLQNFIENNKTGNLRPKKIEYEDYYKRSTGKKNNQPRPQQTQSKPTTIPEQTSRTATISNRPPQPLSPLKKPEGDYADIESPYSTVAPIPPSPK